MIPRVKTYRYTATFEPSKRVVKGTVDAPTKLLALLNVKFDGSMEDTRLAMGSGEHSRTIYITYSAKDND